MRQAARSAIIMPIFCLGQNIELTAYLWEVTLSAGDGPQEASCVQPSTAADRRKVRLHAKVESKEECRATSSAGSAGSGESEPWRSGELGEVSHTTNLGPPWLAAPKSAPRMQLGPVRRDQSRPDSGRGRWSIHSTVCKHTVLCGVERGWVEDPRDLLCAVGTAGTVFWTVDLSFNIAVIPMEAGSAAPLRSA